MTADLCHADAAYVLGALSPSDRRVFEAHLADCSSCQRSVRELAGLPGLLARVRPSDFNAVDESPPATLLPRLIDAVRRQRTRRRWLIGGLAAAAAVAAVLVAFGIRGVLAPANRPDNGVAMTQVADTAISARANLRAEPWGTQIDLICSYNSDGAYNHPNSAYNHPQRRYALVVTNEAGRTRQVATWRAVPNGISRVTGSVGWNRADIAKVEIRTLNGASVLRLAT